LQFYFQGRRNSLLSAIDQLLVLKAGLQKSDWFYRHEIGTSSESKIQLKMINGGASYRWSFGPLSA